MAGCEELEPMPIAGVFADTKWERRKTYEWYQRLIKELPFPVHCVSRGDLRAESLRRRVNGKTGNPYYSTFVPAFVKTANGRGILRRKCTHDFKLLELIRKQAEIVGRPKLRSWRASHRLALSSLTEWKQECAIVRRNNKGRPKDERQAIPMRPEWAWRECQADALAVIWIGMSTDEADRIKDSTVPWAVNRWPLVEKNMSRGDCARWLRAHGYDEPPKSSCIGCPYHDDEYWAQMKEDDPDEFADAVSYDYALRAVCADGGAREVPFLHDSLVPLDKVDFSRPRATQGNLFSNECEGMCGV